MREDEELLGLTPDVDKTLSAEDKLKKTEREQLFGALRSNMDISHARDIVKRNIPEKWQSNVFHCIWFFSTTLPDVATQLLKYVEGQNEESYLDLAYDKIYEAIRIRLQKTYHEIWTTAAPWKHDIEAMIGNIQDKKHMIDIIRAQTWKYVRWNGPTVILWLLPTEWIDIHDEHDHI